MKKVINMQENEDLTLYRNAMEFAKNKRPFATGFGNIYVARTFDRDGNQTSETYGMNMLTEYGFNQYFTRTDTSFPKYLYIGNSYDREESVLNRTSLFSYYTQEHDNDSLRNTTKNYNYPMYYYEIPGSNPKNGIVTCVGKYQTSYFDYTINGVEQDFEITEYGLGTSPSALWTHSWVYDKQGAYAQVTKRTGERLEITIFLCISYQTSIIKNAWANNRYMVLTGVKDFVEYRMNGYDVGTFRRNNELAVSDPYNDSKGSSVDSSGNTTAPRRFSITSTSTGQRAMTRYCNIASFNIYNTSGVENGYIDGFFWRCTGFKIIEPQVLTEANAESFDIIVRDTFDNFTYTSLSNRFGENTTKAGYAPFTQADIQNVYLYDRFQGDYLNPVSFTNDKNHWYTETSLQTSLATIISHTDIKDEIIQLYVYQNLHTEDPISYFDNVNIQTIYATDEYWNRSTWELISIPNDPNQIPAALKTKRYYITSSNTNSLMPVRESIPFTLSPNNATAKTFVFNLGNGQRSTCEWYHPTHGYFVYGPNIYIPSTNATFLIGTGTGITASTDFNAGNSYCYGNFIMSFYGSDRNASITVTNVTDFSHIYSTIKLLTGDDGFTAFSEATPFDYTYRTESGTGLLCIQKTNANEAVVYDMTNQISGAENQLYRKHFDAKMSCSIYSTQNKKQIAYLTTESTPTIKVYDFTQNTDIAEFTLPSGATDATLMWGLNDYLWATNGSSWSCVYKISNGSGSGTNTNICTLITNKTNLKNIMWTCVDDVIIIYNQTDHNYANAYYCRIDNNGSQVSTIFNLSDFARSTTGHYYYSTYKLKYIENGKTLVLLVSMYYTNHSNQHGSNSSYRGCNRDIIDFGQWLNPPATHDGPVNNSWQTEGKEDTPGWAYYGEHVIWGNRQIPIALMMPIRLVGKTRTISAVNYIKNIGAKQFSISITNERPDYWNSQRPGYPPGTLS